MVNKVLLVGRLGQDPDLRYGTNGGAPVCRFSVATNDSYTDREGQRVERTEWHNVVVFNRQAENCANFLSRGSLVLVEGSLQTRKWEDANGQTRSTTEVRGQRVQFLDRKGEGRQGGEDAGGFGGFRNSYGQSSRGSRAPDEDMPYEEDNSGPNRSQGVGRTAPGRNENIQPGPSGSSSPDRSSNFYDASNKGARGGSESSLDDVPF